MVVLFNLKATTNVHFPLEIAFLIHRDTTEVLIYPCHFVTTIMHFHWRRSALNSAGALQGRGEEFRGFALKTYSKHTKYAPKFRGGGEKAQVHVHLWHLLVRRHCRCMIYLNSYNLFENTIFFTEKQARKIITPTFSKKYSIGT